MLHYPKIPGSRDAPTGRCVAFEKYDGTNLHWDWDRDFGWHAFGTRRDEFNLTPDGTAAFAAAHPGLEDAPAAFLGTLADPLADVFRTRPDYRDRPGFKAFTEFVGPNSSETARPTSLGQRNSATTIVTASAFSSRTA